MVTGIRAGVFVDGILIGMTDGSISMSNVMSGMAVIAWLLLTCDEVVDFRDLYFSDCLRRCDDSY